MWYIFIDFPRQKWLFLASEFYLTCELVFWRNKQESVLARLFPAGTTQQHTVEKFQQMLKYRYNNYRTYLIHR